MAINLKQKRWNLPSSKMIKGQVFCWFRKDCNKCDHFKTCISPSGVARDKIDYWAYCHKIREPQTEAMRKGIERHRAYQMEIPTVEDIGGVQELQEKVLMGKYLKLQEVPICSRYWGIHGFIDVLEIKLEKDNLWIKITDLKSNWWKKYLYQMASYAMMMQEPDVEVCYNKPYKRKKGSRRLGMRLFPKGMILNKNIKMCVYFFHTKKTIEWDWMDNNIMSDFAAGMTMQVSKRLREYRPLHKRAFMLAEDIDPKRKDKQRFFGKSKLIKKTKPKIYHEPLYKV